ncbi:MAG: hypothetical protein HQ514_01195, partial [Rhodospirillales bacterium]|nr:hypothetical protein [Rhodospirillales bacterium]
KNTQDEIRFKTWDDKAAYQKYLYLDDMRNKKFGHLLPYAGTTNVNAVLKEPQVQFHLGMLLGDELPHLLDIMRNHGEVNLYGSSLIFDGRGRGEEYAQIQVNLYEAHVEASLYSGGRWTFYTMSPDPEIIPHRVEGEVLYRSKIDALVAEPPMQKFRLISRPVRGKFSHLKQYYGTGNVAPVVNDPELRRVLRNFPGFDFALFYQNIERHRGVDLFDGWLNIGGGKEWENDIERSEIAIDPVNGRVEVAILSDETWTVYSSVQSWRELNAQIKERIHKKGISDLKKRLPWPKFWYLSWQSKADHDVDQY